MLGSKSFGLLLGLVALAAMPARLAADEPLSAIDWLSKSVATPADLPRAPLLPGEMPAGGAIMSGPITMQPLGAPGLDSLGLVPAERAGLPRDLWGKSASSDLARLLRAEQPDTLPAIQSLLYSLLIAELDPPTDSDIDGALFLARVDKLLDLGALDPALSLLELTGAPRPEPFRRWFDVSLLLGQEDHACAVMAKTPQIAPTLPARIFCLARDGDWNAASLSLRTGETLGTIDPAMAALLSRFLDPEAADGAPDLPVPDRPSPLVLRLMEAIGQPMVTATLPVAFAQADLRSNNGWKARIEAGERLARMGAIPANRLFGLYTERKAAASGGVWDRVKAVQALDAALGRNDKAAAATALTAAWDQMEELQLEVPFAELFGARLTGANLRDDAGALAFRIGLLSRASERVARAHTATDTADAFLAALAKGDATGTTPPDQLGVAVQAAFVGTPDPGDELTRLAADQRAGEALLRAMSKVTNGANGDLRDVTQGLAYLRKAGFEGPARHAALELMLLERRG